jgi:hypothetical protein
LSGTSGNAFRRADGRVDEPGGHGRRRRVPENEQRQRARGEDEPAPGEPRAEPGAGLFEPVLHDRERPTQTPGRLGAGQSVQRAEQQGRPQPIGQVSQFVVDDRLGLPHRQLGRRGGGDSHGRGALANPAPRVAHQELPGGPVCDPVEPTCERGTREFGGLPAENEERDLGGVLGVLSVVENPGAQPVDERRVPGDEGGEGGAVVRRHEPPEQLGVGQLAAGGFGRDPQQRAERVGLPSDHPGLRGISGTGGV